MNGIDGTLPHLQLILEHGEGADVHNSDGASPLMVAALMGATEVMKVKPSTVLSDCGVTGAERRSSGRHDRCS